MPNFTVTVVSTFLDVAANSQSQACAIAETWAATSDPKPDRIHSYDNTPLALTELPTWPIHLH